MHNSTRSPPPHCDATPHGEYLLCSARISVWNTLLEAQFREYSNGATTVVRAPHVSVPVEVRPHLTGVLLATELPPTVKASMHWARGTSEKVADTALTVSLRTSDTYCESHPCTNPSLLRSVYNISHNIVGSMKGSQSVFETGGQVMSPADLTAFQKKYGVATQTIAKDVGGNVDDDT